MRVVDRETGNVISEIEHQAGWLQKLLGLRFRRGRALLSFDRPTRAPVDMFLVPAPLDLAFLDADMNVLEVHGAHPVTLNPDTWRSYRPDTPYQHVLEVEAGLLPHLGVEPGHRLAVVDRSDHAERQDEEARQRER